MLGYGSCLLKNPENAAQIEKSLFYFEDQRSQMLSFVVMPTHVHLVYISHPDWPMEKLIATWKKNSAREINRQENRRGNLWQKDYFDRLIRDRDHFIRCVRYIRNNPQKANLSSGEYSLYESELAKSIV